MLADCNECRQKRKQKFLKNKEVFLILSKDWNEFIIIINEKYGETFHLNVRIFSHWDRQTRNTFMKSYDGGDKITERWRNFYPLLSD